MFVKKRRFFSPRRKRLKARAKQDLCRGRRVTTKITAQSAAAETDYEDCCHMVAQLGRLCHALLAPVAAKGPLPCFILKKSGAGAPRTQSLQLA